MKTLIVRQSEKLALIDDEDYDRLCNYSWRAVSEERSIIRNISRRLRTKSVSLASDVMRKPDKVYDHIDRNPFNNQKYNLRECTQQQNCFNRSKLSGTSSKYKGVSYKKNLGKWQANIKINQKWKYLGVFLNEEDAAEAYNTAAKRFFGEFAALNMIVRHQEAKAIANELVASTAKEESNEQETSIESEGEE
jgi:hypothetical protein